MRRRAIAASGNGPQSAGSLRRYGPLAAAASVLLIAILFALRPAPAASQRSAPPLESPGAATAAATNQEPASAAAATASASPPWQEFTVRRGDTLSKLFVRAGLDKAQCARTMALGAPVKTLRLLHPGEQLRLRGDGAGHLTALTYSEDALQTLEIASGPGGLQARLQRLQPIAERTSVTDQVDATLGRALRRAGLDDTKVAEFVTIFHWRVDFRREVRRGTRFSVVYDKRWVKGRELPAGPIVAAELVLHDRTLRAFRFADGDGQTGYYDDHGASLHPTLLRTPVRYTRISSPFSLRRFDPVVRVWRPHTGVDLAATIGTPIEAAGDGRITFIGPGGGYGNLVEMKNFGPYSTRYAHLRRFAAGLHVGSRVHQGQIIGYVGESGEATGPHLHFEIRVNGIPRDPLKVKLPAGAPLAPPQRRRFEAAIRPLLTQLDNAQPGRPQLARNEERTAADRQL